jgi:hypothetical protein
LLLQVTHQLLHFKNPNVVTSGDSGRFAGRSCLLSILIFTSHPFLGQKIKTNHGYERAIVQRNDFFWNLATHSSVRWVGE